MFAWILFHFHSYKNKTSINAKHGKKLGMVVKKSKSLYHCVTVPRNEKCSALNNGIYPYICGHVLVINNMNL